MMTRQGSCLDPTPDPLTVVDRLAGLSKVISPAVMEHDGPQCQTLFLVSKPRTKSDEVSRLSQCLHRSNLLPSLGSEARPVEQDNRTTLFGTFDQVVNPNALNLNPASLVLDHRVLHLQVR